MNNIMILSRTVHYWHRHCLLRTHSLALCVCEWVFFLLCWRQWPPQQYHPSTLHFQHNPLKTLKPQNPISTLFQIHFLYSLKTQTRNSELQGLPGSMAMSQSVAPRTQHCRFWLPHFVAQALVSSTMFPMYPILEPWLPFWPHWVLKSMSLILNSWLTLMGSTHSSLVPIPFERFEVGFLLLGLCWLGSARLRSHCPVGAILGFDLSTCTFEAFELLVLLFISDNFLTLALALALAHFHFLVLIIVFWFLS